MGLTNTVALLKYPRKFAIFCTQVRYMDRLDGYNTSVIIHILENNVYLLIKHAHNTMTKTSSSVPPAAPIPRNQGEMRYDIHIKKNKYLGFIISIAYGCLVHDPFCWRLVIL